MRRVYHVPLAFQSTYGCNDGGKNWNGKKGRHWRLPGLLYADDLALCSESEEKLRAMLGCFIEVCKKRGLKVNAGKSKVMPLIGV